jgi:hypothetical protein
MGRSAIDVTPEFLTHLSMLTNFCTIVGSKEADGVVRLAIEGGIVPDAPLVSAEFTTVTGNTFGQITARFWAEPRP